MELSDWERDRMADVAHEGIFLVCFSQNEIFRAFFFLSLVGVFCKSNHECPNWVWVLGLGVRLFKADWASSWAN